MISPHYEMFSAALLLCTLASFTLDQASKALALATELPAATAASRVTLRRCGLNTRLACGTLGGSQVMVAMWCAEGTALLALVRYVDAFQGLVPAVALGVALGGAAGNVYDRVRRGGVVDFIDLGFWPVFNLADVAIVTGSIVAAWAAV